MVKKRNSGASSPASEEIVESEGDEQAEKIKDSLKNSSKVYY